jgi:hypothetical protein
VQRQHCINIYRFVLAMLSGVHVHPGPGSAEVQHGAAHRQRVVLSLVSTACVVSVWLLWVTLGQAEDAAVTVEVASRPSLEHLRPHTDLAHVTFTALLHGTPLSQGHMKIQLTAPPQTTVWATDYPRGAGTPLLAFDSEFIDGRVTLQYRFPLHGVYTFDLEITPVPGGPGFPPTHLRQTVRIPENLVLLRHTWLLVVGLFVLGVLTGVLVPRVAATRAKLRSRAIIAPLVVCCGVLAPTGMVAAHAGHPEHAAYGAPERQVIRGEDGWELEIHSIPMPVTVGHPLQLALWLRKDDAVFPGMTEVSITAVNMEQDQTVVETHILARQGSTSQSLQLYDGVPHAITVTVRPVGGEASGWAPPTVMLSVDVLAADPWFAVPIRMIAMWLGVLVGGLVVGWCVPRLFSRGVGSR